MLYSHNLTPSSGAIKLVAEVDDDLIGISFDLGSEIGFQIDDKLKTIVERHGQVLTERRERDRNRDCV